MKQYLALLALTILTACGSSGPIVSPTMELPAVSAPTETPNPESVEIALKFVNYSTETLEFFW